MRSLPAQEVTKHKFVVLNLIWFRTKIRLNLKSLVADWQRNLKNKFNPKEFPACAGRYYEK